MDMHELRRSYEAASLDVADVDPDPFRQFAAWFDECLRLELIEPNGMALATADAEGRPSVRFVLLKGADQRGFAFYTNRESRKADELAANARAALVFWWPPLERQVRVTGTVEIVSDDETKAYFESRPPGSRRGAWASSQSRPIADRARPCGAAVTPFTVEAKCVFLSRCRACTTRDELQHSHITLSPLVRKECLGDKSHRGHIGGGAEVAAPAAGA